MSDLSITHLQVGRKAPAIKGFDQDGNLFELKQLSGQKVIVFFYPGDLTPTCTVEVCNLRDNYSALKKAGYAIIGISKGDIKTKKRFADKNKLPFRLIADPDLKIAYKYGVFGEKLFFGEVIQSIHRITFIINEAGKIAHIIHKVKSNQAAQQILEWEDTQKQ
ncbi:MAG: thioredoxin-dependent thiol peroxidase [Chitinophagales bacterium]